jgi:hypothetical protein
LTKIFCRDIIGIIKKGGMLDYFFWNIMKGNENVNLVYLATDSQLRDKLVQCPKRRASLD